MKDMKNIFGWFAFILIIGFMVGFTVTDKPKETITLSSPYSEKIIEFIRNNSKEGYSVKFMLAQSISTSITSMNSSGQYGYNGTQRDVKGDIIVVMEK